jgi:hypothetical protein
VLVGKWANLIELRTVLHVMRPGELLGATWTAAQLLQAANRVSGAFNLFLDNCPNVAQYSSVEMRDLSSATGEVASMATAIAGTDAAVSTGPYEGPVIRWKTGVAGRTNGRTFLPGTSEASVDNIGMLSPDRIAAMTVRATQFLAFLSAATDATHPGPPIDLAIQSSKPTTALPPTRPARKVISGSCRPEVGIQRRRRVS